MHVGARGENLMKAHVKNSYETKKYDIHKGIIEQECNRSLCLINRSIRDVKRTLRDIKTISGYVHEAGVPPSTSAAHIEGGSFLQSSREELHPLRRDLDPHAAASLGQKACDADQGIVDTFHTDTGSISLYPLRGTSDPLVKRREKLNVCGPSDSSTRDHMQLKNNNDRDASDEKSHYSGNDTIDFCSSPDSDSGKQSSTEARMRTRKSMKGRSFQAVGFKPVQVGISGGGLEKTATKEGLQHSPALSFRLLSNTEQSDQVSGLRELAKPQICTETTERNTQGQELRPLSDLLINKGALSADSAPRTSPRNNESMPKLGIKKDAWKLSPGTKTHRCYCALPLQTGQLLTDYEKRDLNQSRKPCSDRSCALQNMNSMDTPTQRAHSPKETPAQLQHTPRPRAGKTRPKSASICRDCSQIGKEKGKPWKRVSYSSTHSDSPKWQRQLSMPAPACAFGTRDSASRRGILSKSAIQRSLDQLVLEYNQPRSMSHLEKEKQKRLQARVSAFLAVLSMEKEKANFS